MFFLVKEEELDINQPLIALYFYASWLPFHKKMMLMIEKIEKKFNNIKFIAINTDLFKSLNKRYSITNIPTVVILKDGKDVKRINGIVLTSAFRSAFVDICNSSNLK